MISIVHSQELQEHLETHIHDGTTVAASLFEGGRLAYPERKRLEYELNFVEPYTLDLEARVIVGLPKPIAACVRYLARVATENHRGHDETLDLLWDAHSSWGGTDPSLDRLAAALVAIADQSKSEKNELVERAALALVAYLHSQGFPPNERGLEELWDGAPPACVGLGMVDL